MLFDEIRAAAAAAPDSVAVPASWTQGRTVYGGLSAGLACDALSQGVDPTYRLRYLNVNFLQPIAPAEAFRIVVADVTAGRTLVTRVATVVQDGVDRVTIKANFVAPFDSQVAIRPFRPPTMKHWDAEGVVGIGGPLAPVFTQHFDFRSASGVLPFQGIEATELGGWMRFAVAPEAMTGTHLVCLIDAWPPAAITNFNRPVPLSTINWGIHFAEPLDGIGGDVFLGYLATVNFFADGYGSSSADIWAPDGRLLAKSFQTFVVYG